MVNIRKLKARMVEKDMSVDQLAEKIGVDRSTLYRRFADNGETFTISEAMKIRFALDLNSDQAAGIFFANEMADMQQEVL